MPRGPTARTRSTKRIARSVREIAELSPAPYPVSERQVFRLLRRDDCPFDTNVRAHPVDMARYFAWYDAVVAPRKPGQADLGPGGGMDPKAKVELQLKLEQALLYRKRREILEERYIRREEHVRILIDYVTFMRDRLEEWVESLPAQIDGLGAEQMIQLRARLSEAYDRLCEDMQAHTQTSKRHGKVETSKRPKVETAETGARKNPAKVKAARKRHRT